MATFEQATQFNALAYYISNNSQGIATMSSSTPASLQTLPQGWAIYQMYTDPKTGQTDVAFTDQGTGEVYIAARGTVLSSLNDILADSNILVGVPPKDQNNAALAFYDTTENALSAKGYTSFEGGGHSLVSS
jgi:hypothetical protein